MRTRLTAMQALHAGVACGHTIFGGVLACRHRPLTTRAAVLHTSGTDLLIPRRQTEGGRNVHGDSH